MSSNSNTNDIVPDDFDLQSVLKGPSSTSSETQPACPECGSIQVLTKSQRWDNPQTIEGQYTCRQCRAHFDQPTQSGERR